MRLTGGALRGRVLKAPRGLATRPMLARIREALFNIFAHRVPGARVADVFAGTGVVGMEALSRGAAHVDFYDNGREALSVLNGNLRALDLVGRSTVHRGALPGAIRPGPSWDLVLVDPPWGQDLGPGAVQAVLAQGRLADAGTVVVRERFGRQGDAAMWGDLGCELVDERRYGDSALVFLVPRA